LNKRLILPGAGGSGEGHWQRWWLSQDPDAQMVEQDDWDHPNLGNWLSRTTQSVSANPGALIVGHSLGATLVAHLAELFPELPIIGALLVAPADVEQNEVLREIAPDFAPMPTRRLPFPSILVASTNDPMMSISRAIHFTQLWGSRFFNLGESGHINAGSGYGEWPGGLDLATQLLRSVQEPQVEMVKRLSEARMFPLGSYGQERAGWKVGEAYNRRHTS
jgi:serine hydrolase